MQHSSFSFLPKEEERAVSNREQEREDDSSPKNIVTVTNCQTIINPLFVGQFVQEYETEMNASFLQLLKEKE